MQHSEELWYHNKNKLKTETTEEEEKTLFNSLALNLKPFKILYLQ